MQDTIFWIVLLVVVLVIEAFTMGLTTIWFAGGALIAWLLALCHVHLGVQVVTFVVVSFLLLIITRPIVMRHFNVKRERTNAESIIGQTGLVTERIDNLHATGTVMVNGMEWTARAEKEIEVDTVVVVKEIKGVKIIVEPKEDVE